MNSARRKPRREILLYDDPVDCGICTITSAHSKPHKPHHFNNNRSTHSSFTPSTTRLVTEVHHSRYPTLGLYGLFIGDRDSSVASEICARNLLPTLLDDEAKLNVDPEDVLRHVCDTLDAFVTAKCRVDKQPYGCTCAFVMVQNARLHVVNLGNSRVVLCNGDTNDTMELSKRHDLTNVDEVTRVKQSGGYIINGKINNVMSVTRSIGHYDFKARSPNLVLSDPHVTSTKVISADCRFVVIASPQLWLALSHHAACAIVSTTLRKNYHSLTGGDAANNAARKLACAAMTYPACAAYCSPVNPLTVIVLVLPPSPLPPTPPPPVLHHSIQRRHTHLNSRPSPKRLPAALRKWTTNVGSGGGNHQNAATTTNHGGKHPHSNPASAPVSPATSVRAQRKLATNEWEREQRDRGKEREYSMHNDQTFLVPLSNSSIRTKIDYPNLLSGMPPGTTTTHAAATGDPMLLPNCPTSVVVSPPGPGVNNNNPHHRIRRDRYMQRQQWDDSVIDVVDDDEIVSHCDAARRRSSNNSMLPPILTPSEQGDVALKLTAPDRAVVGHTPDGGGDMIDYHEGKPGQQNTPNTHHHHQQQQPMKRRLFLPTKKMMLSSSSSSSSDHGRILSSPVASGKLIHSRSATVGRGNANDPTKKRRSHQQFHRPNNNNNNNTRYHLHQHHQHNQYMSSTNTGHTRVQSALEYAPLANGLRRHDDDDDGEEQVIVRERRGSHCVASSNRQFTLQSMEGEEENMNNKRGHIHAKQHIEDEYDDCVLDEDDRIHVNSVAQDDDPHGIVIRSSTQSRVVVTDSVTDNNHDDDDAVKASMLNNNDVDKLEEETEEEEGSGKWPISDLTVTDTTTTANTSATTTTMTTGRRPSSAHSNGRSTSRRASGKVVCSVKPVASLLTAATAIVPQQQQQQQQQGILPQLAAGRVTGNNKNKNNGNNSRNNKKNHSNSNGRGGGMNVDLNGLDYGECGPSKVRYREDGSVHHGRLNFLRDLGWALGRRR